MPIKTSQRSDHADAFIRESDHGGETHDDLAQHLAEKYLRSAATGDEPEELSREELLAEELGGAFIESRAEQEFGTTMTRAKVDPDHEASALPQAVGALALAGLDEELEAAETRKEQGEEDLDVADLDDEPESLIAPDIHRLDR